ncbi:tetratricopeptide repeat protein [Parapedobacter sp. ISTM3]|uniref:type IX secretion system periplasmic lipoprotein PorW/SprE n=1 Tax=Parapedobacter sp. ISTM3 TaxID=2800130 RepID=UPI001903B932|nr:tetratricopeptide repeat protein [Parapedobacter sp. ISTM3]MBK1440187.1 tetratricopeptide repeat protein [Parapedobacter sp. ISTM3]
MSYVIVACAVNRQDEGVKYDMMENLTARYNIVYHGRKIIADVERENFASHQDNYQQLLPIFVEPTEATAAANGQLMDSVIGKALDIINKKTRSKYINEAYLLTGKANYLKANYYNAVEFFSYVAHAFADMPAYRQAALIGKARSLMQLGNLHDAGLVLDTVFLGLESDKRSQGLAFATQAKYYLLTHDEESAITMLRQAVENTRHKPTKLRWHFLLGQLLQKHGYADEAHQHYRRVINSNAPYEMSFYAGLNSVYLATDENATGADRVRLLRRMLRDDKNAAFKDQIYYQIAEVFYADGHLAEALANYEMALQQPSNNRYQTALTYLKLADHYFSAAEYTTAKHYYDSVGMSLPADFPDVGAVQRKIANLDDLITQLQVVARQDSLQYLAALDDVRREAVLDTIVSDAYARQFAAESEPKHVSRRSDRRPAFDDILPTTVSYTDNRFYFNNPDAMGMGQAEFRRRWGNRQLRDNWRFSDMLGQPSATGGSGPAAFGEGAAALADTAALDSTAWVQQLRGRYIEALPDNEAKLATSHGQIHDALLRIGNTYRDELRDNEAAINTYEELLKRYPDTEEAALLYYNLYRLYTDVDEARAAYYKDRLLTAFPDALYSHLVRDPSYMAKLEQQKRVLDQAYENVYTLYTQQRYPDVIEEVTRIRRQNPERQQIASQLGYLQALALGRTASLDTFEHALLQLVEDFPDDSLITPLVAQHLAFIEVNRDTLAARPYALQGADENRERFVDEPTMTLWPQLVINHGPEPPRPRRELAVAAAGQAGLSGRNSLGNASGVSRQQLAKTAEVGELGPNVYRDLELLPDSATYFFVINVMNERVNLAPSRFGIGQFNRTRYAGNAISHQLKVVNGENQLVYIGPFYRYDDAKRYETSLLPLLPDIMKIPADIYNTFVITETYFGTLSDFDKIDDYHAIYQEQMDK